LPATASRAQLAALETYELLARYRRGVENFSPRIFDLTDDQLDMAFLPDVAEQHGTGRWPARVLLGHLADAELVCTHRIRRVACEESPLLEYWDEDAFIDAGIYAGIGAPPPDGRAASLNTAAPDPAGFVATIHTLRQWTAQWLGALNDSAWERRGMHAHDGPMTLKDLVAFAAWHLEHHSRFLSAKLDRLLGPAPIEDGCGANCACRGRESQSG
jgi:hypothetical protein